MSHRRKSIGFRLTLLFAVVSTVILVVLGMLTGKTVQQHFVEQDIELLTGDLHRIGRVLEKVRGSADLPALLAPLEDTLAGHQGLVMLVRDADDRILYASAGVRFPPGLLERGAVSTPPRPLSWRQDAARETRPMRGVAALLPTGVAAQPPLLVAVALDITHHEHFMASFQRTLWLFVAAAAVSAGALGWLVVRRGLAPLHAIRHGAAGVSATRLNFRLSPGSIPVELAELAETLNAMFARLEDSFQRLKEFSSDLAHELRTPISNLLTQTQVVLSRARSVDEYQEVLVSNVEELERMARMVGDMLFLAQADNGLVVPRCETVDLAQQVRELFDYFDALAENKSLRLSLSGSGEVLGDTLMLRRALANLLSNAIRHTPVGGRIAVRIDTTQGSTVLAVENTGEPIPAEKLRLCSR